MDRGKCSFIQCNITRFQDHLKILHLTIFGHRKNNIHAATLSQSRHFRHDGNPVIAKSCKKLVQVRTKVDSLRIWRKYLRFSGIGSVVIPTRYSRSTGASDPSILIQNIVRNTAGTAEHARGPESIRIRVIRKDSLRAVTRNGWRIGLSTLPALCLLGLLSLLCLLTLLATSPQLARISA